MYWTRKAMPAAAVFAILIILGAAGCSDDDNPVVPADELAPPTNLTFINGATDVLLDWDASLDASDSEFAGYGVYRHTASMAGATEQQLAQYRLNEDPVVMTSYLDDTVSEETRYFYAVRAVLDNGEISTPTNQIDTAVRDEFDLQALNEFANAGEPSGLDCSGGAVYSMSSDNPDNRPFIDIYLGTTDSGDDPGSPLALKSPHLVLNQDDQWSSRVAELKLLDSYDDPTTSTEGWSAQVVLGSTSQEIVGKVVAVRTPISGGRHHYAKILVEQLSGSAGQRALSLLVAYQPIPDYIRFRQRP